MLLSEAVTIFLASVAGSYHCLGMCGGFACSIAPDATSRTRTIIRHLIYNSGRTATYIFLGGIGGVVGKALTTDGSILTLLVFQKVLAVTAGILMFIMAAKFLSKPVITQKTETHRPSEKTVIKSFLIPFKSLFNAPGRTAPLALGVLNGFLPCPLVYAFLALATAAASPLQSMLLMAIFGLGTFPAMLAAASLNLRKKLVNKPLLVKIAGLLILLVGLVTFSRAFIDTTPQHFFMWSM